MFNKRNIKRSFPHWGFTVEGKDRVRMKAWLDRMKYASFEDTAVEWFLLRHALGEVTIYLTLQPKAERYQVVVHVIVAIGDVVALAEHYRKQIVALGGVSEEANLEAAYDRDRRFIMYTPEEVSKIEAEFQRQAASLE